MFTPERITEALAEAQRLWGDKSRSSQPTGHFTIAVSRQTGTYGAAIAREVGDRLGWPVYDRELLLRIADDMGVHRSLLESVDERREGWLSEAFTRLFSGSAVNEAAYFRRLIETLVSLGSHGDCVIVGRGAPHVLPEETTLRVRIVAPLEHRIEAVQKKDRVSREVAAQTIETKDRERNRFLATHFRIDPTDPAQYDLVLNVGRFSTKECADLVLAALAKLRARTEAAASPANGVKIHVAP